MSAPRYMGLDEQLDDLIAKVCEWCVFGWNWIHDQVANWVPEHTLHE